MIITRKLKVVSKPAVLMFCELCLFVTSLLLVCTQSVWLGLLRIDFSIFTRHHYPPAFIPVRTKNCFHTLTPSFIWVKYFCLTVTSLSLRWQLSYFLHSLGFCLLPISFQPQEEMDVSARRPFDLSSQAHPSSSWYTICPLLQLFDNVAKLILA